MEGDGGVRAGLAGEGVAEGDQTAEAVADEGHALALSFVLEGGKKKQIVFGLSVQFLFQRSYCRGTTNYYLIVEVLTLVRYYVQVEKQVLV